jgi:hypothetical protein
LLGTRLAARIGLPTPPVAVVEVSEELIRLTPALTVELPRSRIPCRAGLQFGSCYPGTPGLLTLHDFLPDEQLREVLNLHDFACMLVFDKWTCNTNGRQTLFFRPADDPGSASKYAGTPDPYDGRYQTVMIDQGFCFNAGEWSYPDAPLRGLYTRNRVYEGVTGMESFGPWISRIQNNISERVLDEYLKRGPARMVWRRSRRAATIAWQAVRPAIACTGSAVGSEKQQPAAISELAVTAQAPRAEWHCSPHSGGAEEGAAGSEIDAYV